MSLEYDPEQNHVVPYLADFNFGTRDVPRQGTPDIPSVDSDDPDERTGWQQDPRARPFYATRVTIVDAQYLSADQVNPLRTIFFPPLDHYPPVQTDTKYVAYQAFGLGSWQLYKLPDILHIPFNRIYSQS